MGGKGGKEKGRRREHPVYWRPFSSFTGPRLGDENKIDGEKLKRMVEIGRKAAEGAVVGGCQRRGSLSPAPDHLTVGGGRDTKMGRLIEKYGLREAMKMIKSSSE